MASLRSSEANPQPETAQIPVKAPLDSESRSERQPRSQTLTADPALGGTPKDSLAPSFSTEPPRLGSVAGGTEHIIKDSTEEISGSHESSAKSRNEDIMNGRYTCFICEKYVRPVSYVWHCQVCSRVLHLSCAEMKDWRCPTCHRDPLQNNAYITRDDDTDSETVIADDNDEPPLKNTRERPSASMSPRQLKQNW